MSIIGSDPLAFLTAQGGVVGTPLTEGGAGGADNLDQKQRSAVVGEPIPIVFCRRVSGTGGVLISPPATEARFEDDASSNITASYHLVLSEGRIDSIQVRDVFQRACRVGSFTQTYDRRAGTFVAGNFIDNTPNLEAPTYCGTSGTYDGLSTMAFSVTIPAGFDQWDRQVHCFIRGGIYVSRLLDSVTGPSNNVCDLLLYLLRNSSRVPEAQIDTASLLVAATFTNANGFWFNGVVSGSTNLRDWISNTLQYFLLRQARIGGKEALKPLVPTNSNGTIKTTAVSWEFTFTEEHVIPDSFEITYTPLADRKPFCVMALWRQQDDLGIPVMRTAEVRYAGTAEDGPYEQHDLSGFCASENHAVKVGAYILSKRRHVTHRLQIGVKPDAFNPTLAPGDLVRVRLERVASTGASSLHDYIYEVDRIGKSVAGEVRLELTHFPVDAGYASVVAQEVDAATGSGILLPTGLSGVTCDINSSSDTSVPADTSLDPSAWDLPALGAFDFEIGSFGAFGLGGIGISNPDDGLDGQEDPDPYEIGLYFYNATWVGNVLQIQMRLDPTGKAPREDLGALFASIASTSVVALLPNEEPVDPQPSSLPTVSFTGQIAAPWDAEEEGSPVPPGDRIFEGQFNIEYPDSAFPPVAEDPEEQLTYRATVEFNNWSGGFTDVTFQNTLTVDFELKPAKSVFYWDDGALVSTGSESIFFEAGNVTAVTVAGQPGISSNQVEIIIEDGLLQSSQSSDFTFEWFASGIDLLDSESASVFINVRNANNDQISQLMVAGNKATSLKEGSGSPESATVELEMTGLVHLSIQRVSGVYYLHAKGQPIDSFSNTISGYLLSAFFSDSNDKVAIFGQGRFTAAALYGTGNFTPPSTAFYVP